MSTGIPKSTTFKGPVVSVNGFQAGAASSTTQIINRGTVTVTPAAIAAATTGDTSVTITGLAVGDTVVVNPPAAALAAGLAVAQCEVSAANTLTIRIANVTAAAITPASGSWTYCQIR